MSRVNDLGQKLDLDGPHGGSNLTNGSYVYSASTGVGACKDFAAWLVATAGVGTPMTSITFKLQISYDDTNWIDIYSARASTGGVQIEHALSVSAGNVTYEHIATTNHRMAKYLRIGAKAGGGNPIGDDNASAYFLGMLS